MKYLKFQQDLLKNALMEPKNLKFGEFEDSVGVADDHVLWLIPKSLFMFDFAQLEKHDVKRSDIGKLLNYDSCKYEDAVSISELKKCGNKTLIKIKGESKDAWVDMALLKFFDAPQFKVGSPTSALIVFERGQLAGLVMPMRTERTEKTEKTK